MKTPILVKAFYKKLLWNMPREEKVLYLTFDDGPIPEVTPWVLETLEEYDAAATFFCIGDNVRKHPEIFKMLTGSKHAVGNHTFHHVNGWKTEDAAYLKEVKACAEVVESKLFRPPYGRIRKSQSKVLLKDYQIVMWDVLSGDFDPTITPEKCEHNVLQHAQNGSIIVFHDSLKAQKNLQYALPQVLEYFSREGYVFKALPG